MLAQVFDTYKTSQKLDNFINYFPSYQEQDLIVIAACMDDCVTNLSELAKKWFEDLGSK